MRKLLARIFRKTATSPEAGYECPTCCKGECKSRREESAVDESVRLAEEALSFLDQESPEETVWCALANLMHFCAAKGIDFEEELTKAYATAEEESEAA